MIDKFIFSLLRTFRTVGRNVDARSTWLRGLFSAEFWLSGDVDGSLATFPQEPIRWCLHLPYKPLESTLSRVDLKIERFPEEVSRANKGRAKHFFFQIIPLSLSSCLSTKVNSLEGQGSGSLTTPSYHTLITWNCYHKSFIIPMFAKKVGTN